MIRKIAFHAFVTAILTALTLGVSQAATGGGSGSGSSGDQGTYRSDQSTMGSDRTTTQDRSDMHRDKKVSMDLKPSASVSSKAKGESDFKFDEKDHALSYKIKVDDIKDVTAAHVHKVNPDGTAGEVLAPLYPEVGTGALPGHGKESHAARPDREGKIDGTLSEGKITDDQLTGSMKGKSTAELYDMLRSGQAGVNVHTRANPNGEIWGASRAGSSGTAR